MSTHVHRHRYYPHNADIHTFTRTCVHTWKWEKTKLEVVGLEFSHIEELVSKNSWQGVWACVESPRNKGKRSLNQAQCSPAWLLFLGSLLQGVPLSLLSQVRTTEFPWDLGAREGRASRSRQQRRWGDAVQPREESKAAGGWHQTGSNTLQNQSSAGSRFRSTEPFMHLTVQAQSMGLRSLLRINEILL